VPVAQAQQQQQASTSSSGKAFSEAEQCIFLQGLSQVVDAWRPTWTCCPRYVIGGPLCRLMQCPESRGNCRTCKKTGHYDYYCRTICPPKICLKTKSGWEEGRIKVDTRRYAAIPQRRQCICPVRCRSNYTNETKSPTPVELFIASWSGEQKLLEDWRS
jgi:hypothetical protein